MKKNIFYMAMAAFVAFANVACSSDDDNATENYTPTLPTPKYESEAVAYTIPETEADHITTSVPGAPAMTGVNITESGQAVFELDGGKTFKTYKITSISGNTYTLENGTIQKVTSAMAPTRGTSTVQLIINVTIELEGGQQCNYSTGNEAVSAQENKTAASDDIEAYLCRTWTILGVTIEYQEDGKQAVFREFDNGNLKEMADYANEQGAGLTANELAELNRNISEVVVDKNGLIVFNYSNRPSDAAQWSWANSEKTQLRIKLKDSEMGNKFLSDNTTIDIAFKDTRCVLKLKTRITGSKNYNVALALRLQSKD